MPPEYNPFTQSVININGPINLSGGAAGTVTPGVPIFQRPLIEGLPGMNSQTGFMLQMMLQPMLSSFITNQGFLPAQFSPTQNLFDVYRAREIFQNNMSAMQLSTTGDEMAFMRTVRGVSHLVGADFGLQQRASARSMAASYGNVAPFLAMMAPELVDEMAGARGSSAVMSHFMHMGGRYARDPVTGLTGLTGATAGAFSEQIFDRVFARATPTELGQLRGMTAGSMGRLYDEISRRGLLGTALTDRERTEVAQRATGRNVIERHELDAVIGSSPGAQGELRNIEASRIADRLKGLSGVVSAMRDIFGDIGKPNAPMPEIINALEALTQGGLASMSPGQLESVVRRTHNLSRITGMGIDNMAQLIGQAARFGDSLGLNREFAVGAAQHGAALASAYSQFGRGDLPYFNRPTTDEVRNTGTELAQRAAVSPLANMLNAALYIGRTQLQMADGSTAAPGTEAEALIQAIQRGQQSFSFGGVSRSVAMNQQSFMELFQRSGVSMDFTRRLLSSPQMTQGLGRTFNTPNLVRALQGPTQYQPVLEMNMLADVQSFANQNNINQQQVQAMARTAYQAAMFMPQDVFANDPGSPNYDPTRRDRIGYIAEHLVQNSGTNARFDDPRFRALAAQLYTNMGMTSMVTMGYSFERGRALHNPEMLAESARIDDQVRIESELQGVFSQLGRFGPLRNIMSILQDRTTPGTSIEQLVAQALGGIPMDRLDAAARNTIQSSVASIHGLTNRYSTERNAGTRSRMMREINVQLDAIRRAGAPFMLAGDAAVTLREAQDLSKAGRDHSSLFVESFGEVAESMLGNESSLRQLGRGAVGALRGAMADSQRFNTLLAQSGMTATQFLGAIRDNTPIANLSGREQAEARGLFGSMRRNAEWIEHQLQSGGPQQGANAISADELREARALTTPSQASSLIGRLSTALSVNFNETQRGEISSFLTDRSQGRSRSLRMTQALSALDTIRSAIGGHPEAARLLQMSPSELLSTISSRDDLIAQLGPDGIQALSEAAPLTRLRSNPRDIASRGLRAAFADAPTPQAQAVQATHAQAQASQAASTSLTQLSGAANTAAQAIARISAAVSRILQPGQGAQPGAGDSAPQNAPAGAQPNQAVTQAGQTGGNRLVIAGRVRFEAPNWLVFEDSTGFDVPRPGSMRPGQSPNVAVA